MKLSGIVCGIGFEGSETVIGVYNKTECFGQLSEFGSAYIEAMPLVAIDLVTDLSYHEVRATFSRMYYLYDILEDSQTSQDYDVTSHFVWNPCISYCPSEQIFKAPGIYTFKDPNSNPNPIIHISLSACVG